jgi:hypothetical protein
MKAGYYYKEVGCDDFNGPFTSISAAEKAILKEHKEIWESSCNCLQSASSQSWCNPVLIFKAVKTVKLEVTANIKLIEQ